MKKENVKISRIARLKGFDRILAGRDLADIFKDGHVYSVVESVGVIMLTDLGEHAVKDKTIMNGTFEYVMMDGTYLLTKPEFAKAK